MEEFFRESNYMKIIEDKIDYPGIRGNSFTTIINIPCFEIGDLISQNPFSGINNAEVIKTNYKWVNFWKFFGIKLDYKIKGKYL